MLCQVYLNSSCSARFIQAVSELQFLGFIKSTRQKTDHVQRLTWGACWRQWLKLNHNFMPLSNIPGIYLHSLKILLCCKTSPVKVILAQELVELFIKFIENVALFDNMATWRHLMSYRTANWKRQDTCRQQRRKILQNKSLYIIDKIC